MLFDNRLFVGSTKKSWNRKINEKGSFLNTFYIKWRGKSDVPSEFESEIINNSIKDTRFENKLDNCMSPDNTNRRTLRSKFAPRITEESNSETQRRNSDKDLELNESPNIHNNYLMNETLLSIQDMTLKYKTGDYSKPINVSFQGGKIYYFYSESKKEGEKLVRSFLGLNYNSKYVSFEGTA